MGYAEDLQLAAAWISRQQDPHDGGWGLAPNQASSLVNTAEAVDVLWETGVHNDACARGISFLIENTFIHAQKRTSKTSPGRGERIRYVAFPLLVVAPLRDDRLHSYVEGCKEWLLQARNKDFAWGDEANDQASKLFPTFLAIRALQEAKASDQELKNSYIWVRAQSKAEGWSLYPQHPISAVATAYGVLCLRRSEFQKDERVEQGRRFLLQTNVWHPITDDVSGTVWQHPTCTWVLSALSEVGEIPYSPTIAGGIRYINSLKKREGAPWAETPDHHAFSIRSQYWAVVALRSLQLSFDPSIHAIRIDAERASEELTEPMFLKFRIRSPWAVVVPAQLYQYVVYSCFILALIFSFSFDQLVPRPPKEVDLVISVLLLAFGWQLMRLRRRAFPAKIKKFVTKLASGGVLVGALFGVDGYSILSGAVQLIEKYLSEISTVLLRFV